MGKPQRCHAPRTGIQRDVGMPSHDFEIPVRVAPVHARRRTRLTWLFIPTLAMALTAPARAEDPPTTLPVPAAPAQATRWYGWEGLLVDVPSFLMMGKLLDGSTGLAAVGAVSFLVVPPVIHLAHGHPIKAIGSFAMRAAGVGTPLALGLYVSHQDCRNGGDLCWVGGEILLALSALLMIPAAFVIDDAAIAREQVPPPKVPDAALTPWVAPISHGGFVLGVQGLRF